MIDNHAENVEESKTINTLPEPPKVIEEKAESSAPLKLLNAIKLMAELIRDYVKGEYKQTPWRTIAAIIFSILYLINPFDLIPDFIPGIGWLDDMTIIGLVMSGISRDLKDYCNEKGQSIDQFGL
jgi:uncharacterized membrane protein YkvA (DUF1232 family)